MDEPLDGPHRDLAVVGASAGGVEALTTLARGLPADIPAAFLVVLHLPEDALSHLPDILDRAGPLDAIPAEHGAVPQLGAFHIAPPGRHLIISAGRMQLLDGPRENNFRPAIDPLFRSAARSAGRRSIGVVLSGTMDDGAAGMQAIRRVGGATVVQDPADAMASGMPVAVLDLIEPDHVVPVASMGRVLAEIAAKPLDPHSETPSRAPAAASSAVLEPMEHPARGVDLTCPDCGGALQEIEDGHLSRYRCRVGHVYSPTSLLDGKGDQLEAALWTAARTLEEHAAVARRLAERSRALGSHTAARRFDRRQADAAQRADLVREAITSIGALLGDGGSPEPRG